MNPSQRLAVILGALGLAGCILGASVVGGVLGAVGILIAVAAAAFSIASLSWFMRTLVRTQATPRQGVKWTLVVGILKLPLTLTLLYVGLRLSEASLAPFVVALLLVYSVYVWFLAASSQTPNGA